ncbi:ribonuclease E/G [Pseudoroseicyclus sp. CXY001]|uniref:Rne/Rng family ribonuclease n=1 Tax=Pseudoroseicyclus sp. CXY001 TaxID=3242492 RepID=UPI003570DBEF
MAKKMLIDATHAEETRVVVADGNKVEEFDFESAAKRQLAGNIYLAKVTRVEASLQAAFVDYGGNRHGFLAFSEIHPDYYQIPVADREALLEEERAYAEAQKEEDEEEDTKRKPRSRSRSRSRSKASDAETSASTSGEAAGMETIDLGEDEGEDGETPEGASPMETVAETPVETPSAEEEDDDTAVEHVDKDTTIESAGQDDDSDDVRPARKARPKRYKIQEVVKVRQIMLVQVVKEERGNKGAALTTYLSLAGRYCVLMPNTARGGGISRKITNAADRKKLKEIAGELDVPKGAGLIIRTAGSQRTKSEIKRDYEYLQRMWEQIRELTLKSVAPAKIYEEGDLIKRSIRDLYSREIDEVIVEGEAGYRNAKDFMKMIMPSHAKNVKPYIDPMPLFARYQVETTLAAMFNPTVQLPSGGYIVIGITEALVAIDVNSGRATKEGSIEQTALKTNLEAAEEVARQMRLRDLAGLIVIDFIDMDERKNNTAVEKRLKDKLKTDRARIQVGRISGFGLLEMSRQRLRPGMLEATTQPCSHCHGTGLLRSDDNVALGILRQLEEEGVRGRSREVLVKAPVGILNFLYNSKREHIAGIEQRYGMAVRLEGDPTLISPDYTVEKFKTATRAVPEGLGNVIQASPELMEEAEAEVSDETPDEDEIPAALGETPAAAPAPAASEDDRPKKKRRRRRRRRGGSNGDGNGEGQESRDEDNSDDSSDDAPDDAGDDAGDDSPVEAPEPVAADAAPEATPEAEPEEKPKRRRSRSRKKPEAEAEAAPEAPAEAAEAPADAPAEAPAEAEEKPKRRRTRRKKAEPEAEAPAEAAAEPEAEPVAVATPPLADIAGDEDGAATAPEPAEAPAAAEAPAPAPEPEPEPEREPAMEEASSAPAKPKRRGWWSRG